MSQMTMVGAIRLNERFFTKTILLTSIHQLHTSSLHGIMAAYGGGSQHQFTSKKNRLL
jgi:hypothetical protein